MYITKQIRSFSPGTVIYRTTGDITLATAYDSFHGWYETTDGDRVTPADLLGCECSPVYDEPAEIRVNGRWYEAQQIEELIDDDFDISEIWCEIIAEMDSELRESVCSDLAGCEKTEILAEYLRRASSDIVIS
jgi:hypothetical protein